jgi:ATPase family protein associated with various cellular activities (AAA)
MAEVARIEREAALMAGRLAALLERLPAAAAGPLADGRRFLLALADTAPEARTSEGDPLDRLVAALRLSQLETDLLVLAGLPEHHEGCAGVLRHVHPRGEPAATTGIAAQLFAPGDEQRRVLQRVLVEGRLVRSGALSLGNEGPFVERSLEPAPALWPALCGLDAWPERQAPLQEPIVLAGLERWLAAPAARRAGSVLRARVPATVLVTADDELVALGRAAALVESAGSSAVQLAIPAGLPLAVVQALLVHALLRGCVPVLRLDPAEPPALARVPDLASHPAPVVVAARVGGAVVGGMRPVLAVPVDRLDQVGRRAMWTALLPSLNGAAPQLAARHSVEPAAAAAAAADAIVAAGSERRAPTAEDVGASLRARAVLSVSGAVRLLHPVATWRDLVLRTDAETQLREAVARLAHADRVLDDWGFLAGRSGARGVRMLFTGPPGTGKTLSAEVVAGELGVELLVVDLSRVVSKWIGETEKNLADVFDAAERAQAVLFFDEADALFGRRTDVSDAHDRYANLETAYLLMRLERFEGLAILASNLRHNLDPAFVRRLEFVVEFEEPGLVERRALWRCHLPEQAPLADDVRLDELAEQFAVVGALIRNAAVSAGFLAVADGGRITQTHILRSLRREYQKAGRAFPGLPAGSTA